MILLLIPESLVLGFVMAAPVGPVGILCIRRTLKSGWRAGLSTGLGVAAVDSLYGLIACLGTSGITQFITEREHLIRQGGGVVLLIVGFFIYRSHPEPQRVKETERHGRNFISAVLLALTNPLTILSFAAVYLSLNMGRRVGSNPLHIAVFVMGIFIGSGLWWLFLSRLALRWKKGLTPQRMLWINRICGLTIAIFGLVGLASI